MKKMKKISTYFICMMLSLIVLQIPVFAEENNVNGTQKVYVEGKDWGPAVTKTVIEFEKVINADSISKEDFKVVEEKNASSVTERKILDAYTSDNEGNKITDDANYVTIEMYVSPKEGSPFVYKTFNEWCELYKLNISLNEGQSLMSGDMQITQLNIESEIDVEGDGKICPQLEGFDMSTFTASDGKTLSYGAWEPQEDDHKNPLIIWLHGAGEGGTDTSISILGNRVTGLIDEKTQTSMNGAYVLVPQTPTAWMDGYDLQKGGHSIYSTSLMELIKTYVESHTDIDDNRIYIGGCSNGGYMTLEMLTLYPDYFAAAYPICTGYSSITMSDENLEKIKDIPIWFVYALNDGYSIADQYSQPLIERLRGLGAKNIYVSEFDDVHDTSGTYWGDPENPNNLVDYESGTPYQFNGHFSWVYAFNNECYDENDDTLELFSWLANQKKSVTEVQEKPSETTDIKQDNIPVQSVKTGDDSLYRDYALTMMVSIGCFILLKRKYA